MKLNRTPVNSIPQSFTLSMFITILLFSGSSALAQSPASAPAPDLKVLGIRIESKTSTQLQVERVPVNNQLRPTEAFVYRSELGRAPRAGDQYEYYEKRKIQSHYAVLRVTNAGTKTIKSVDWEYTNPRFKGDKVVVYRKATSRVKIGSGETVTMPEQLPYEKDCGMTGGHTFGQQMVGKSCGRRNRKWTGNYPVEAKLLKITYEDGTVWKAQP
jgi:hypothetical protein